jgi:hypothetical protein
MLTQDPTTRAAALLKGATKPIRIFLGFTANGRNCNVLAAALDATRIKKTMPHTEITVPHTLDPEQLSQALTDQWAQLYGQLKAAPVHPTTKPDRRHHWRRLGGFSRSKR